MLRSGDRRYADGNARTGRTAQCQCLCTVSAAGEILGEISLVDSRLPAASVAPESETTVLQIGRGVLRQKLKEDPAFGSRFYHALAIVLAQRLQRNTLGGGGDDDDDSEDDIDADLLENVSLAGLRFDQLLKRTLKTG